MPTFITLPHVPRFRLTPRRLKAASVGAFFRPRDLEPLGITFPELQRLVAAGTVEKVAPGIYRLASAEPSESRSGGNSNSGKRLCFGARPNELVTCP